MRLRFAFAAAGLAIAVSASAQTRDPDARIVVRDVIRNVTSRLYQGRNGPEQTERFSRKLKLGKDGRVSVQNIAGDITVSAGTGDEVSIEAVKRTRGDRSELAAIHIIVDERSGRVDVRTEGEENRYDRNRRSNQVSVDYTLVVPVSATVDLHSVSGTNSFSGSVRSDLPMTLTSGSDRDSPRRRSILNNRTMRGTFGDGSATVTLRTFSGNIVITKR